MILSNAVSANVVVTPPNCDAIASSSSSSGQPHQAGRIPAPGEVESGGEEVSSDDEDGDGGDEEVEADLLGWNGTLSISWESVASGEILKKEK